MKKATIYSRCECQAQLVAELDENRHVFRGWAVERRRKRKQPAPAHSIGADKDRFDVAWYCPFCIRNTLRSFDVSGLVWEQAPDGPPEQPDTTPSGEGAEARAGSDVAAAGAQPNAAADGGVKPGPVAANSSEAATPPKQAAKEATPLSERAPPKPKQPPA